MIGQPLHLHRGQLRGFALVFQQAGDHRHSEHGLQQEIEITDVHDIRRLRVEELPGRAHTETVELLDAVQEQRDGDHGEADAAAPRASAPEGVARAEERCAADQRVQADAHEVAGAGHGIGADEQKRRNQRGNGDDDQRPPIEADADRPPSEDFVHAEEQPGDLQVADDSGQRRDGNTRRIVRSNVPANREAQSESAENLKDRQRRPAQHPVPQIRFVVLAEKSQQQHRHHDRGKGLRRDHRDNN